MTQTKLAISKTSYTITWEKLPDGFQLPDDPVENIYHPLLASALREILEIAGFIITSMLIASNFGICATVDGKIVVKAPDWLYVPNALPIAPRVIRRSYTPHAEGDVPAVVMEFLSDTEQGEYSAKSTYPYGKWYFYERILQVPIYVIFEPNDGTLEVHDLVEGHYQLRQADANGRYLIASMNLFLGVWHGTKVEVTSYWLRWWDEAGNLLPWGVERVEQSLQEGIQQGKLTTINRMLNRKIGAIAPDLQSAINALSPTALDELSEVLLDFSNQTDLANWLTQSLNIGNTNIILP
jgi:Uma2 family endonuclease